MSNKWTAEGAHPDVVSYWYFVASVATWFITPLVFMLFSLWVDMSLWFRRCPFPEPFSISIGKETCHPIIYYPFMVLASYIISALWVYIGVPLYDIYLGFNNLFCHEHYKHYSTQDRVHEDAPALKLPEQLGEAIPQFVIAVVFFTKNSHWLSPWEMILGGVTMTLSCGSILFGVAGGVKAVMDGVTKF